MYNDYDYDYANDDDNIMDMKGVRSYNFDDEDYEENDDYKLVSNMDNDLAGYFSDARVFAKKTTSTKKKQKQKTSSYKIGDKVTVKGVKGSIIFGPYEVDKKKMYEIELDNGELISIDDKKINK